MNKLDVWLEITHLLSKKGRNKTGIGHYTANLIRELTKLDKQNNYTVFGNLFFTTTVPKEFTNASYKILRVFPGKVWNQLIKKHLLLPLQFLFLSKPDVMVFFNYVRLPVTKKVKTITAIYDLAFYHYPEFEDKKNKLYLDEFVPRAIKDSNHIITISEATKRDIVDIYKITPDNISIVYPAIDHAVFLPKPINEISSVKQKYDIDKKYILFEGTLVPRKNVDGLLDAYASLPANIRNQFSLVLVGGKGWRDEGIEAKLSEYSSLSIITTGYVDEADLPALYSGADLFILPSHFEGFGMPLVEAMACGTPVIAGDNSSMPEVVGEAGVLVDTQKVEQITEAIKKVLGDSDLSEMLRRKGLEQSKKFDWQKSAKKLEAIIETVATSKNPSK